MRIYFDFPFDSPVLVESNICTNGQIPLNNDLIKVIDFINKDQHDKIPIQLSYYQVVLFRTFEKSKIIISLKNK